MTRLRAFDPLAALALIAAANMALAIALIPRDPMRAWDLWALRGWVREWLVERHRLYDWPASGFDYPPWAIVTFAPVGLLPADRAVLIWAAVNLLAIGLALVAFARLTESSDTRRLMLVPVLLVLCWGGTRTLLMFTPVSLAAGALGILYARRPVLSGVLLGIAAAKPQIALPFLIWAAATRRVRALAVAALVVLAEYAVYGLWIGDTSPVTVLQWLQVVGHSYTGGVDLVHHTFTNVCPLLSVLADPPALDVLTGAWALLGLVPVVILAGRLARSGTEHGAVIALALGFLWCLLSFWHRTNNNLLFVPVFFAIYAARDAWPPFGRRAMLILLQVALTVDIVPRVVRAMPPGLVTDIVANLNRAIAFCALGYLALVIRAETAPGPRRRSPPAR